MSFEAFSIIAQEINRVYDMSFLLNWRRHNHEKYIDKIKHGVVFYEKPNKLVSRKVPVDVGLRRHLQTKRVRTHGVK